MPIPAKPGAYRISGRQIAYLCHADPDDPVWFCTGSAECWTPEKFSRIWGDHDFERLVPEIPLPRDRTPVEVIIRETRDNCPLWNSRTPIHIAREARQTARQLLDVADYYEIQIGLCEHVNKMRKLLSIEVPDTLRKGMIENAVRAAIDALIQDAGWSCAEEDLDAETERRYLEAK